MAVAYVDMTTGQSNAIGAEAKPPVTVTGWPKSNALRGNTNSGALGALGPRGDGNQTPSISAGNRIAEANPTLRCVQNDYGIGGQLLTALMKNGGSGAYETAVAVLPTVFNNLTALGDTPQQRVVRWIQGEADLAGNTRPLTYKANFAQMRTDYRTDLAALAGFATAPWFLAQTPQWGYRGAGLASTIGVNPVGVAQWEMGRDTADIFVACPMYQFEYQSYITPGNGFTPSPLHLSARGQEHMGEVFARAEQTYLTTGKWAPLQPLYAVKGGVAGSANSPVAIDVKFQVPTPPLRFDLTAQWGTATNYGFALAGTDAAIVGVDISGPDVVRLTVDRPILEPYVTVSYGLRYLNSVPIPGADPIAVVGIGNLCDSETATSAYDGTRLSNWCVHSSVIAGGGATLIGNGPSLLALDDGLHEIGTGYLAA